MRKIALIPAYMPDDRLLETINELDDVGFETVVVDDGSGEEYAELFSRVRSRAALISYGENKGKGAAIKAGLEYITENFFAPFVIVTVDADGQHKASDAARVAFAAESSPHSLILGSRRLGSKTPIRSRMGNAITRIVFGIASGRKIYDTQTGLRAFDSSLVRRLLQISGERYEYEMNMLMELSRDKTEIIELPIETVYIDGNSSSHFDAVKDSYRIYKEILKFSASSLISFLIDYSLFCLFSAVTGTVIVSNILARVLSGTLNFTLNRRFVFKSGESVAKTAAGYAALAICILICNTLIVKGLCMLGISKYIAKLITEALLFATSWLVQHKLIFKRRVRE